MHDAVVVGSGRTHACLVVESAAGGLSAEQRHELAQAVAARTADFNKRLFAHERIEDPKRIIVVEPGTLPRTKVSPDVADAPPLPCACGADIRPVHAGERQRSVGRPEAREERIC